MSTNSSPKSTPVDVSSKPPKRRLSSTLSSASSADAPPPSSPHRSSSDSSSSTHKRLRRDDLYDARFSAIEEHGVIGNMRTCALVSVSAEVDWFCYPYFDSPSIFAAILDPRKGGHWCISAHIEEDELTNPPSSPPPPPPRNNAGPVKRKAHRPPIKSSSPEASAQRELLRRYVTHKQLYHSDTNVLISRFLSDNGVGQVMDYMPAGKLSESAKRWLVRELMVVRGQMTFQVELVPAFNYARDEHEVVIEQFGCRFISRRLAMELRTTSALDWELTEDGKGVTCLMELNENEREVFVFCESVRDDDGQWRTADEDLDAMFKSEANGTKQPCKEEWNEMGFDETANGKKDGGVGQQSEMEAVDGDDSCEAKARKSAEQAGLATKAEGSKKSLGRVIWKSTASLSQSPDSSPATRPASRPAKPNSRRTEDKGEALHDQLEEPQVGNGVVTKSQAHQQEVKQLEDGVDGEGEGEAEEEQGSIHPVSLTVSEKLKGLTIGFWRDWIAKCTYNGRWREVVYRSALVLKLMTFEPTGAIVAALTTSLPEEVGGERNWDYRFTWIRDSSFTLYAFLKLGFKEEASAFMHWISQRCEESSKQDGSLQIMYGLHGEHTLEEKHLEHLEGFRHSTPVRIGNGAYNQVQLDIYGELMDTVYLSNKYAEPISYDFWRHVRRMVDWVCEHWHEEDEGVWETRGGRKPFVYSKVMSWVAVDRGIRLAEKRSFPAEVDRWRKVRDEIYEEVQTKGWNEKRRAFTQSYGSDVLDASVLIMPLVFFAAPTDPRFVSTLEQVLKSTTEGGLVSNNLVFRYTLTREMNDDGLKGQEGTFSICTFWAVEAAARLGAYRKDFLEKSRFMFEQMLGYANHLGLYSEEIGKRGEHLGNFPQAFTHLALISAAINLDKALTHRVPGQSHMDV